MGIRKFFHCSVLFFLVIQSIAWAEEDAIDPRGESLGFADIPNPIVFDFVKRLGAKKGELESSVAVFEDGLYHEAKFSIASELEWAPADDTALELELIASSSGLSSLGLMVQQTLGQFGSRGEFVHAGAVWVEREFLDNSFGATPLYLIGQWLNRHWSYLLMAGATVSSKHSVLAAANFSIFYTPSPGFHYGVEVNSSGQFDHYETLRIVPQIHLKLSKTFRLQGGIGGIWHAHQQSLEPSAGLRLMAHLY